MVTLGLLFHITASCVFINDGKQVFYSQYNLDHSYFVVDYAIIFT